MISIRILEKLHEMKLGKIDNDRCRFSQKFPEQVNCLGGKEKGGGRSADSNLSSVMRHQCRNQLLYIIVLRVEAIGISELERG